MSDESHQDGLPEVHDEAGDTPRWVPLLGFGLLLLVIMVMGICAAIGDEVAEEQAAPAEAVEAAGDDG